MTGTCESCRFLAFTDAAEGECRRLPPHPTPSRKAAWPLVRDSDWCGEHLPRFTIASAPVTPTLPQPTAVDRFAQTGDRRARACGSAA